MSVSRCINAHCRPNDCRIFQVICLFCCELSNLFFAGKSIERQLSLTHTYGTRHTTVYKLCTKFILSRKVYVMCAPHRLHSTIVYIHRFLNVLCRFALETTELHSLTCSAPVRSFSINYKFGKVVLLLLAAANTAACRCAISFENTFVRLTMPVPIRYKLENFVSISIACVLKINIIYVYFIYIRANSLYPHYAPTAAQAHAISRRITYAVYGSRLCTQFAFTFRPLPMSASNGFYFLFFGPTVFHIFL